MTRVDKRELAWQTEAVLLPADLVDSVYVSQRSRFVRGFDVGYDAGYEDAVAAERERIIAELEKWQKYYYGTDADVGILAAIEIVKGKIYE